MNNMLNFRGGKRFYSQFLISDGLSKKGQASIFNLIPLLPPQQTTNKQYLSIIVSEFVMEQLVLFINNTLPASTDLIRRKENDKVQCLTYCAVGVKKGYMF